MNPHILTSIFVLVFALSSWATWLLFTIMGNTDPNGNILSKLLVDIIFQLKLLGGIYLVYGQIMRTSRLFKDLNIMALGMVVCSSFIITIYEGIYWGRTYMLWIMAPTLLVSILVTALYLVYLRQDPTYKDYFKSYHWVVFFTGMTVYTLYQSGNIALQYNIYSQASLSIGLAVLMVILSLRFLRFGIRRY